MIDLVVVPSQPRGVLRIAGGWEAYFCGWLGSQVHRYVEKRIIHLDKVVKKSKHEVQVGKKQCFARWGNLDELLWEKDSPNVMP